MTISILCIYTLVSYGPSKLSANFIKAGDMFMSKVFKLNTILEDTILLFRMDSNITISCNRLSVPYLERLRIEATSIYLCTYVGTFYKLLILPL